MRTALDDDNHIIIHFIDYSVCLVDPSAPITLLLMLQRLGLADARERVTVDFF
jgi:hypothetical protein